jgi:hypothetical protein
VEISLLLNRALKLSYGLAVQIAKAKKWLSFPPDQTELSKNKSEPVGGLVASAAVNRLRYGVLSLAIRIEDGRRFTVARNQSTHGQENNTDF